MDAEGHGFYLNFVTYGTSLTGSYNTSIFNNNAYSFDNFNPAQIILNKIVKTNISCPSSTLPSSINNPDVQKYLLSTLNIDNNNVLTPTQISDCKITLKNGSSTLVKGDNLAVLNLNFFGSTATKNITISYV